MQRSPMVVRRTMNVSLAPELERFVAETVASGRYRSASEVVRAALRLLEREEQKRLRRSQDGVSGKHTVSAKADVAGLRNKKLLSE